MSRLLAILAASLCTASSVAEQTTPQSGDDLVGMNGLFPKMTKLKKNETVVFSWIVYKSKAHRNAVNKKVMKDARIARMMKQPMPFDDKRMAFGGFKMIVDM